MTMTFGEPGVEYRPVPSLPGFFAGADGSIWRTVADGVIVRRKAHFNRRYRRWSVWVCAAGRSGPRLVAWLVAEAFHGPRPIGQYCCHKNGNSSDDRADNLKWDTPAGNSADAIRHGTATSRAMTAETARRIVTLKRSGLSVEEIATVVNHSPPSVYLAATGRTWSRVTGIAKPA